ncbi:sugar phosphate isomerase/epimerase family protein [Actinophytocola gossypii]|uniref:Sugar phosphate isomerase/epimerase n=1 Tax=Actinophytocola gossypii TaxID=2812003 RepID=A0ABT2JDD0_9PSEU|nr:sugar phosphate isomerase/epimerase family protein [Actinophytocola gossypii]MCT2585544.1 sugar phosphate isomerase/epimerase [Actinophytocola gossypii]
MPAEYWPPGGLAGIGDEAAPDLAGQLRAIGALGWPGVELRTVDGRALADLDRSARDQLVLAVARAGLRVPCLDSRIGSWSGSVAEPFDRDLAELATLAELCADLDTSYVRIMSYPNAGLPERDWRATVLDRVRRLTEVAERAGITLLHENCAGWAGTSAERAIELLDAVGSPALRLLFDVGNGIAHGYDAAGLLADLVPFVAHVHVKDAVGGGEDTAYTLPGDGQAGVVDCLKRLRANGYAGALSIEPHLATRPHEGRWADAGGAAAFVAAGRRLAELVRGTE